MILDYIHIERDVILSQFNYKLYIKKKFRYTYVRIEILEIKTSAKLDM